MFITKSLVLIASVAQVYAATTTSSGLVAQVSPVFPSMPKATGVVTSYNPNQFDKTVPLSTDSLQGYPTTWKTPSTNSDEVKAVYNSINWSKVPNAPVRKQDANGNFVPNSDGSSDPYCWWSSTNCVKPKASYLPADIYTCPNQGDWGLNYDDGPFIKRTDKYAASENPYAEPALYNFLSKTNQKASLFYIGSNVVTYPAAAKRGLNDGHHLCVHTWSHPAMTTKTNAEVVSELYWALKAIKEATGVTSKCWRPPYGDVDDRVRSIAWQMGLSTILWDEDTNDWNMPAAGNGGTLAPKKVDAEFQTWINNYKSGKDKHGHIVLEHEITSATVNMSMFWMPKLQETFNVIPALACNGVTQPYWETQFVYPTDNSGKPVPTKTSTTSTATPTTTVTTVSPTATPTTPATCTPGSFGLGNGDGYNGACCKDQSDCWDDCVGGKCNGPINTKTTSSKTTTTLKTTTTVNNTSTKTTTTSSPTSSCIPGVRGKKMGNGNTGYCCSSSDDCIETCRKGTCGL